MARKTTVTLVDDLDGGTADESLTFGLDGLSYEIDLSTANAKKLREILTPYVEGGSKLKADRKGRGAAVRTTSNRERSHEIREWAKNNGIKVNERGRIPASVIEQYEASH